jgi:hypothetical protein
MTENNWISVLVYLGCMSLTIYLDVFVFGKSILKNKHYGNKIR